MANRHPQSIHGDLFPRIGVEIADDDGGEAVWSGDGVFDRVWDHQLDLGIILGALHHDVGGAELRPSMDQQHLGAEFGEVVGLFHGGVTTANHSGSFAFVKEPVAGGTGGKAAAHQLSLAWETERPGGGAGGDDHSSGVDFAIAGPELEGFLRKVDTGDLVVDDLGAKALCLGGHIIHELLAHDGIAEPREILHLGGGGQLSTMLCAGEDRRLKATTSRIDCGCQACRAGTDNDGVEK